MLVKCPECSIQISDKAYACPHCGYPLKPEYIKKLNRKSNRRRRLPNGFGQISEIKNRNLRKPFRARITVGKASDGSMICKPLKPESYFETYNDAYEALMEYKRSPYDVSQDITLGELYEKWSEEYFKTLHSAASIRTVTAAWNYCSSIEKMNVSAIRVRHLKGCIEEGTAKIKGVVKQPSAGVKGRMKSLFNLLFDYAVEYELTDKNYARLFNLSDDVIKEQERQYRGHIPFTDLEIETLWNHLDRKYVDVVLIQCYGGWRPQELGLIRLENVHVDEEYMVGGIKTDAGIDRIVPIHSKIRELVEHKYKEAKELNSDYLINCTDSKEIKLTYDKYQKRFEKIVSSLGLNEAHRAHDGRSHFITMAKKHNVDEYAIKYIIGHSINDLTERVYTKRNIDWLKSEMEKIK